MTGRRTSRGRYAAWIPTAGVALALAAGCGPRAAGADGGAGAPRAAAGERAPLAVVEDGAALPIVVFPDAPPRTRRAAEELAEYIGRISGAEPEVIHGRPDPPPERAVWVGFQPQLKELLPGVDFGFRHPEEVLLAATDRHVVIAGRDRWDPEHMEVQGIDEKVAGKQQEYGTANAVYTFLQRHLGVRWLWPGELGEDVPRRETIALRPFEFRHVPQIRGRAGALAFSVLGNRGYGRAQVWSRRQRLQLDSLGIDGGHAFADWWERFHEEHRELFALQPDGTRSGFPSPGNAKLCQSNPAVWKQWLADVAEQLDKDPTRTTFNGSPNDGWFSGHCVCEKCSAWDHPEGERRRFRWKGRTAERPALSDRHITFANHLAELLEQRYPGRGYLVQMAAYGHSRPAPVKARPAENVIVVSVANFFGRTHLPDRGSPAGVTHREQFAAWGKLTDRLVWRPNTGSPAGWQQGLPDVSIAQTAKDLRFVAAVGCVGIYIDSVWEHWATQGPQYYVMAQLLWDPAADANAVLDDYYARGFGPAAGAVRGYYELLERTRMAYVEKHRYRGGVLNLPRLYTEELLEQAERRLRRAAEDAKKAADRSAVYGRRVAFVRAGLAYTRLVIENVGLMRRYWLKTDVAAAERALENWQRIERLCEEHPYAINWGPIRPRTPRMLGLHPSHPNRKWRSALKAARPGLE